MGEKKKSDNKQITDENIANIKAQYEQYSKLAKEYEAMAFKAMGALEVLTELKDRE